MEIVRKRLILLLYTLQALASASATCTRVVADNPFNSTIVHGDFILEVLPPLTHQFISIKSPRMTDLASYKLNGNSFEINVRRA